MLDNLKIFNLFAEEDTSFVFSVTIHPTLVQQATALQHDYLELKFTGRQISGGTVPDG